jgi:ADP-heptose:LPS heptosyltransferase
VPALESLKTDFTEVWISSAAVPLILFADRVRAISSTQLDLVFGDEFPPKLLETLQSFDEIVSWYGTNRPEFRAAMHAFHPCCTFLDALPKGPQHATDFFLKQVGAPTGASPRIEVAALSHRNTIVIHPFSGSATKNWPLHRYQELAQSLPVEWTAGPEEPLADAWRTDNLLELARWMKGATFYIGNDSGISHLAAAIGMPCLILFGPTDPSIWAPRGVHVKILRHQPLKELAVEAVLNQLPYSP